MCNLYSNNRERAMIADIFGVLRDLNNNQPPQSGIYPDYTAPVILNDSAGGRIMKDMRWGLPSSSQAIFMAAKKRADGMRAKGKDVDFDQVLKLEPDGGTTNVRNTSSKHWVRWLGPENRCLVPFTSFAEPDQVGGSRKNVWFALDESRPVAAFAGIWTPWACVRKIKTGWEENLELYGFLTTDSAEPVKTYHDKAMPVILTEPAEWDRWLSPAPWSEVADLQRPRPDILKVVALDGRKDEMAPA